MSHKKNFSKDDLHFLNFHSTNFFSSILHNKRYKREKQNFIILFQNIPRKINVLGIPFRIIAWKIKMLRILFRTISKKRKNSRNFVPNN
jgi:hypothetical protein